MTSLIVVDANVPVRAALDREDRALEAFAAWSRAGTQILAPDLWLPEALTAVRRAVANGSCSLEAAEIAVDNLFRFPIRVVATDRALAGSALRWAGRIGQSKSYDALYLALAERHEALLVTADKRLLARCQQLGIDFVEGPPETAAG